MYAYVVFISPTKRRKGTRNATSLISSCSKLQITRGHDILDHATPAITSPNVLPSSIFIHIPNPDPRPYCMYKEEDRDYKEDKMYKYTL